MIRHGLIGNLLDELVERCAEVSPPTVRMDVRTGEGGMAEPRYVTLIVTVWIGGELHHAEQTMGWHFPPALAHYDAELKQRLQEMTDLVTSTCETHKFGLYGGQWVPTADEMIHRRILAILRRQDNDGPPAPVRNNGGVGT